MTNWMICLKALICSNFRENVLR